MNNAEEKEKCRNKKCETDRRRGGGDGGGEAKRVTKIVDHRNIRYSVCGACDIGVVKYREISLRPECKSFVARRRAH